MGALPAAKTLGAHASATPEGDPYHGYPSSELAPVMLQRVCEACAARWRAAGVGHGHHGAGAGHSGARERAAAALGGAPSECT